MKSSKEENLGVLWSVQDQQKRIIIEQHCIEQQRIIEQQEQQGRFEQQQRVYFGRYFENYLQKQSQHLTTNFGELYTIEFFRCCSDEIIKRRKFMHVMVCHNNPT